MMCVQQIELSYPAGKSPLKAKKFSSYLQILQKKLSFLSYSLFFRFILPSGPFQSLIEVATWQVCLMAFTSVKSR